MPGSPIFAPALHAGSSKHLAPSVLQPSEGHVSWAPHFSFCEQQSLNDLFMGPTSSICRIARPLSVTLVAVYPDPYHFSQLEHVAALLFGIGVGQPEE